jgi:hypothetical protein
MVERLHSEAGGVREAQLAAPVAIFDLDRTLVPGSSTAVFARMLVDQGLV